jgi:hypothetical protein
MFQAALKVKAKQKISSNYMCLTEEPWNSASDQFERPIQFDETESDMKKEVDILIHLLGRVQSTID